jgi:hypothetical protein
MLRPPQRERRGDDVADGGKEPDERVEPRLAERPRRGCASGASTPRANPEGSQAQDALGKTEMAVVVPTKSPAPGEAGLRGPN